MNSETPEQLFPNAKWEILPKQSKYPSKRWGHTATILKNKLYIFGGKAGKSKELLYEIDCDTFQSCTIDPVGLTESRQSHSCSAIKDKLYVIGGCYQDKAFNDCLALNIQDKSCVITRASQLPNITERESHATTVIYDKYILLYGGCDDQIIYGDFWVFNPELQRWFPITNLINKTKKRLSCTLTSVGSNIFMFGGEHEDQTYDNSLFLLSFSSSDFTIPDKIPTLTCQLIQAKGMAPPPRSSHTALSLKEKYLLVLGGEGLGKVKQKPASVLLNDFWAFDTGTKNWIEIQGMNKSIFKPRSCFTANVYQNKIIIFGGLISIEGFRSSDQLIVFSFAEASDRKISLCNICKLHFSPINQCSHQEKINIESKNWLKMDVRNIFKTSQYIKNSLDAFCLYLEGFRLMGYKKVNILTQDHSKLIVKGSGYYFNQEKFSVILQTYDFVSQIYPQNEHTKDSASYLIAEQNLRIFNSNIKNASSRLGSQFLVINKRSALTDLLLINFENIIYCQVGTGNTTNMEQKSSYEIIKKFINKHSINLNEIEDQEMMIIIARDKKNIELESQSFNKKTLQKHLSSYFLNNSDFSTAINGQIIKFNNIKVFFLQIYDQYEQIPEFEILSKEGLKMFQNFTIKLLMAEPQINSSILIYRSGIRVSKLNFEELDPVYGYIQIPPNLFQLNIMRTKLQPVCQKYLNKCVRQIIKDYSAESGKRKKDFIISQDQFGKKNVSN